LRFFLVAVNSAFVIQFIYSCRMALQSVLTKKIDSTNCGKNGTMMDAKPFNLLHLNCFIL